MRDLVRQWIGLEPGRGQTPREFANIAAARLAEQPAKASDFNLPAETVVVYYRARFGRELVSEAEKSGLARRLDRLETDLGHGNIRLEPGAS
jgi:hypothetical protein